MHLVNRLIVTQSPGKQALNGNSRRPALSLSVIGVPPNICRETKPNMVNSLVYFQSPLNTQEKYPPSCEMSFFFLFFSLVCPEKRNRWKVWHRLSYLPLSWQVKQLSLVMRPSRLHPQIFASCILFQHLLHPLHFLLLILIKAVRHLQLNHNRNSTSNSKRTVMQILLKMWRPFSSSVFRRTCKNENFKTCLPSRQASRRPRWNGIAKTKTTKTWLETTVLHLVEQKSRWYFRKLHLGGLYLVSHAILF